MKVLGKIRYIIPFLTALMVALSPLSVWASENPPVSTDGSGAAIVLVLVGFILLLVAIVAIIAAVSLGIIGIGMSSVAADE